MEQFTVNLLAEMGAQPESLSAGLVAATQSTDTTPPSSTITSPTAGETFQDGSQVTITGTATDTGGGVVAGVEVSTDNGNTWHPATLTTPDGASVTWSYTWPAHGYPSTTIKSRAVDDSANLETPTAGVKVNISCPCSIWGNAITPPTADSGDAHSVEVGMKFTSEASGRNRGALLQVGRKHRHPHRQPVEHQRRTPGDGDVHQRNRLRLAAGQLLHARAITPDTTYIASYFDPSGHYAASPYYFYTPPATGGNLLNSPPLHAVSASAPVVDDEYTSANGLYSYGAVSTFPTRSFEGTNYWVDPVFVPGTPTAPGQVTNVTATAGNGSAAVSWSAPSSGGAPTTYTITPYVGGTAQPATTVTGSPPATTTTVSGLTNGTSYTFTVTATNAVGSGPASSPSNAVTPTASITAPSAPAGVSASAGNGAAAVTWTAPSNGGSPITSYTITPYTGSTAQPATTITGSPPTTSTTITGLTNGTTYTFTVTATNAIGNGPASEHSNAVTPTAPASGLDTIFGLATPTTIDSGDTHSAVVGVKFSSEVAGNITGIRFYKAATNTGTHVGSLWSAKRHPAGLGGFHQRNDLRLAAGQLLQRRWRSLPNTTYVASYLAPNGHYSDTSAGFSTSGVSNPPLSALANSLSPNGVYAYSTTSVFPTSSYKATNYWVDVNFEPSATIHRGR